MRAVCHLVLLTLALAVGGCQHASTPPHAVMVQPYPHPQSLDRVAYERHVGHPPAAPAGRPMPTAVRHAPVAMPAPVAAPVAVPIEAATPPAPPYTLDSGDKLRITVFGQEGLTNSYFVDAAGNVTLPLIGPVPARGLTTQQLARAVTQKLRGGFIREPHVAIEVEIYRPFFILGEVTQPGQYPYVPNMTVETAVAIAGGFTPRAYRYDVKIDRPQGGTMRSRSNIPLLTRIMPGDTIIIKERWF